MTSKRNQNLQMKERKYNDTELKRMDDDRTELKISSFVEDINISTDSGRQVSSQVSSKNATPPVQTKYTV